MMIPGRNNDFPWLTALALCLTLVLGGTFPAEAATPATAANLAERLIDAARNGRSEEVRRLVREGAPVDARDASGATALMWAASVGDLQAVRFLLQHGADPMARGCLIDVQPFTGGKEWFGRAIHAAAGHGHLEVVRYLLDAGGVPPEAGESRCGGAPLPSMCKGGPETQPLLEAAASGFTAVAGLLLERGAKVDAPDDCGETPLLRAALSGNPSTVELLLAHGANPAARDHARRTLLHAACWGGSADVLRLAIEAGVGLEERDVEGRTPLFYAVQKGSEDLVRVLLDAGADPTARDDDGETPDRLALRLGFVEIADLLEKALPDESSRTGPAETGPEDEEILFQEKLAAIAEKLTPEDLEKARKEFDPEGTLSEEDLRNLVAVQRLLFGGGADGEERNPAAEADEAIAALQPPEGMRMEPASPSLDLRWNFRNERTLGYLGEYETSGKGLFSGIASLGTQRTLLVVEARGNGTADIVNRLIPDEKDAEGTDNPENLAELFSALVTSLQEAAGNSIEQGFQEDSLFIEGTPSQRQSRLDTFPVVGKTLEPGRPVSVPRSFPVNVMNSRYIVKGSTEVRYVADLERDDHVYALIEARTEISTFDLPRNIEPPGDVWMRGRTFLLFDPDDGSVVESRGVLVTHMDVGLLADNTLRFTVRRLTEKELDDSEPHEVKPARTGEGS